MTFVVYALAYLFLIMVLGVIVGRFIEYGDRDLANNPQFNRQERSVPNTEIIKEWVDALRSGEYDQGQGCLTQYQDFNNAKGEFGEWERLAKPRFCCLGVLCDIAEKKGVVQGVEVNNSNQKQYAGVGGLPPQQVEEWAGVAEWQVAWPDDVPPPTAWAPRCGDGCVLCDADTTKPKAIGLASLNDNHGWTFPQIADVIEKEWLNV
jgi:hypothetical protein